MASAAVMTAVETKVSTEWSGLCAAAKLSPVPTTYWANSGGDVPSDGSAFLEVEYPVANEAMASVGSLGSNLWREEGTVRFVLYSPTGSRLSQTPFPALLDALRAKFRLLTLYDTGGNRIQFFEASPPAFKASSERGAYCELSAVCSYWFDLFA